MSKDFPEIFARVKLRFGNGRLLAPSGVQQGDPLGPFLLSLVILQFIDGVHLCDYSIRVL